MNLDDYITGTNDPLNPANWEDLPPLTELEEQQEWNQELLVKIKRAKKQLAYCIDLAENGTNELLKINLKKIKL